MREHDPQTEAIFVVMFAWPLWGFVPSGPTSLAITRDVKLKHSRTVELPRAESSTAKALRVISPLANAFKKQRKASLLSREDHSIFHPRQW